MTPTFILPIPYYSFFDDSTNQVMFISVCVHQFERKSYGRIAQFLSSIFSSNIRRIYDFKCSCCHIKTFRK